MNTQELLERQNILLAEIVSKLDQLIQASGKSAYQWTPEGLPICPGHGEVMPKREKQGDVWFSHKVIDPDTGEVSYCRGYPGSPGWGIGGDAGPEPGGDGEWWEDDSGEIHPPATPGAAAAAPVLAAPVHDPKLQFYSMGGAMVKGGKITPAKFNSIAAKAKVNGWEGCLIELNSVFVPA